MKTIVYISRHSQPLRDLLGEYHTNETEQIRNEKNPLSVEGEIKANIMSELSELRKVKLIYSSHYVRAISTAKYIAYKNNIKLNIDSRFGERKFGVKKISELPKTYFEDQFMNWDHKLPGGENLNEVSLRMKQGLFNILEEAKGETSMIVAHGTSLTTMLKDWCEIKLNNQSKLIEIYFKDRLVFDGNWQTPELFKLTFENHDLIDIENIKTNY